MRTLEAVNGLLISINDFVEVLRTERWLIHYLLLLNFIQFDSTLTFLRQQLPSQPEKWNV